MIIALPESRRTETIENGLNVAVNLIDLGRPPQCLTWTRNKIVHAHKGASLISTHRLYEVFPISMFMKTLCGQGDGISGHAESVTPAPRYRKTVTAAFL